MASNVPSSRHLANRAYTDCQGPYASGISRHCAPLRTIQSIPFSILRSSFRGRPRFPVLSGGSSSFTRSHCFFVNSYRFIFLFTLLSTICAIFIFQTRPNLYEILYIACSSKNILFNLSLYKWIKRFHDFQPCYSSYVMHKPKANFFVLLYLTIKFLQMCEYLPVIGRSYAKIVAQV